AAAAGTIDHVSSDHAPSTRAHKTDGSIWDVHFGLPGVDTTLPALLAGAAAGKISYERLVELYSERPARAYGLWPRKGSLAPGADADVVLIDPDRRWEVADEDILSRAGRTFVGGAIATYVRGRLVAGDRTPVADPGWGRFVAGAGSQA